MASGNGFQRRFFTPAVGSTVGATLGLVYVVINAGALHGRWSTGLRLAATAMFLSCLVALARPVRWSRPVPHRAGRLGRRYGLVVAAEVALLLGGRFLLLGPLNLPSAALPWVTLVVGAHFFALAQVLQARSQHLLGAGLSCCGLAGLVLALTESGATGVAVAAGVCPGFLLLAVSLRGLGHRSGFVSTGHRRGDRGATRKESQRTSG